MKQVRQAAEPENDLSQGTLMEDFLTPSQRLEAVAEILSAIAVRIIRKHHETTDDISR